MRLTCVVLSLVVIAQLFCPFVVAVKTTDKQDKTAHVAVTETAAVTLNNRENAPKAHGTKIATSTPAATHSKVRVATTTAKPLTKETKKRLVKEVKRLAAKTPAPTTVHVTRPHSWPKNVPHHCCPLATGSAKWECLQGKCAKFEWRESKSAITAILLQCFFGTFAAGYIYYGYNDLAVIQILLTLLPCGFGCFLACKRQCCGSGAGHGSSSVPLKEGRKSKKKDYGSGSGSGQCDGAGVCVACDSVSSVEGFGKGTGSGAGKKKAGQKASKKSNATAEADRGREKDGCCEKWNWMLILTISSALVYCGMVSWVIGVAVQISDYSVLPQQSNTCLETF